MTRFRCEIEFPDIDSVNAWLDTPPERDYAHSLPHDAIPNDAEACPAPRVVLGLQADSSWVRIHRSDLDPWNTVWLSAAAHRHGGIGRAVVSEVPYQWEEDTLNLLVSVDESGIDTATLSGRQLKAYLDSDDLPSLKEMKARLRALRARRSKK